MSFIEHLTKHHHISAFTIHHFFIILRTFRTWLAQTLASLFWQCGLSDVFLFECIDVSGYMHQTKMCSLIIAALNKTRRKTYEAANQEKMARGNMSERCGDSTATLSAHNGCLRSRVTWPHTPFDYWVRIYFLGHIFLFLIVEILFLYNCITHTACLHCPAAVIGLVRSGGKII